MQLKEHTVCKVDEFLPTSHDFKTIHEKEIFDRNQEIAR